eukprot:874350-Prymnesium_polylepis.1
MQSHLACRRAAPTAARMRTAPHRQLGTREAHTLAHESQLRLPPPRAPTARAGSPRTSLRERELLSRSHQDAAAPCSGSIHVCLSGFWKEHGKGAPDGSAWRV